MTRHSYIGLYSCRHNKRHRRSPYSVLFFWIDPCLWLRIIYLYICFPLVLTTIFVALNFLPVLSTSLHQHLFDLSVISFHQDLIAIFYSSSMLTLAFTYGTAYPSPFKILMMYKTKYPYTAWLRNALYSFLQLMVKEMSTKQRQKSSLFSCIVLYWNPECQMNMAFRKVSATVRVT